MNVHYKNANDHLILVNPELKQVNKIELYNLIGQQVLEINDIPNQTINEFKTQKLNTGTYIIKMYAEGNTASKKVLVH